MANVFVGVPVKPGPADLPIVKLMCFTGRGQDCLTERRYLFYIGTEEGLLALTRTQCRCIPLNRVKGPKHLVVMLRGCAKILIRNRRLWGLAQPRESLLELP
eukprot:8359728-Pyramimonas_sp.AAC.1